MDKRCVSCGKRKPLREFYKDPRAADGAESSCKSCTLSKRAERRANSTPEQTAMRRAAARSYTQKYRETEQGKAKAKEYRKANPFREQDRDRRNARAAVQRAVRRGWTPPAQCEGCGKSDISLQAHHHNGYDADHRLDVLWLCVKCHGKEHRHDDIA